MVKILFFFFYFAIFFLHFIHSNDSFIDSIIFLPRKYSQSGFMCMMFYRRDTHVAEIQMGTPAGTVADACAMSNFDINKLSYITLLGTVSRSGVFRNLIKQ